MLSVPSGTASVNGFFGFETASLTPTEGGFRARLVADLDREYPEYQFARHKGYPTALHRELLKKHGVSPVHRRSFGPVRDLLREGPAYVANANATCLALAQIETREAMENLDSIMAVQGLDGVYVGPSDLARRIEAVNLQMVYERPVPENLRQELMTRIAYASNKDRRFSGRRHGVPPV